MRRFDTHYRLGDEDRANPETFNAITHDMDNRVHALEELRGEILELRDTVLYQAAQRIDEFIIPGLESLRLIQSGGFLVAEIADETAVSFIEGSGSLAVDESYREIFRPTPFVAMVREGSPDDWAIAQVLDYIEETGVLSYDIVAVSGDAGPWQDVIVSATAGSVMAQIEFLASARLARDLAADWAEKPDGQDVDGAGTRSAKHHAGVASAAAGVATGAAGTAITKAGEASDSADAAALARDKAQDWAEKAEDAAVEAGQYSAKHHAAKAAASALAAAAFDPSIYTPTDELADVALSGDYGDLDNKPTLGDAAAKNTGTTAGTVAAGDDSRITGAAQKSANLSDLDDAATAFGNIKQNATDSVTGVVELAVASEIRGASGSTVVTSGGIASASALTTPSGSSNFAPDWSTFIVADWNVDNNRTLSNPTNVIVGTTRYVFIRASSGTRAISFGSNYKGNLPTLNDVTSSKWYLLSLVAYSSTHIVVTAVEASP